MFSDCGWPRVTGAMEKETADGGDYFNSSTRVWRANKTGVQGEVGKWCGEEQRVREQKDIGADGDGLKQTIGNS